MIAGISVAAVTIYAVVGVFRQTADASNPGAMDAMSIDMDPAQSPANTGTSIGTVQGCAQINENNQLDADEDTVDSLTVDVVAQGIPSGPAAAIGTSFTLLFPAPGINDDNDFSTGSGSPPPLIPRIDEDPTDGVNNDFNDDPTKGDLLTDEDPGWLKVRESDTPYAPSHGWAALVTSDVISGDGLFSHSVLDLNTVGTSGSGAISRLTIETEDPSDLVTPPVGVFDLTLTEAAHISTGGGEHLPAVLNNATVAINTSCASPTPTPSPSPTPTPEPSGTATPPPSGSSTPTPTASNGGSPTPTGTPTPTPTGDPGTTQGDVDCDNDADAGDALFILRFLVNIPPFGDCIAVAGDVDCDADIDAVDALQVLKFVGGFVDELVAC
ncbi:MAG: hypothetical protein ACE5FA_03720 [Dehalococcoidia bacterium]